LQKVGKRNKCEYTFERRKQEVKGARSVDTLSSTVPVRPYHTDTNVPVRLLCCDSVAERK
jgi:hypothetical protein